MISVRGFASILKQYWADVDVLESFRKSEFLGSQEKLAFDAGAAPASREVCASSRFSSTVSDNRIAAGITENAHQAIEINGEPQTRVSLQSEQICARLIEVANSMDMDIRSAPTVRL